MKRPIGCYGRLDGQTQLKEIVMRKMNVGIRASIIVVALIMITAGCTHNKNESKEEGGEAKKISAAEVPAAVSSALNQRFPGNQVRSVEKENENGMIIFDYELTQDGRKYEADIKDDGTIIEIEKQVAANNVPAAVTHAVQAKFPGAKIGDVMEVNKVSGKTETPDHYEVTLTTGGKEKEVNVTMDGKVEDEHADEK
jgi:hypothetical protein